MVKELEFQLGFVFADCALAFGAEQFFGRRKFGRRRFLGASALVHYLPWPESFEFAQGREGFFEFFGHCLYSSRCLRDLSFCNKLGVHCARSSMDRIHPSEG